MDRANRQTPAGNYSQGLNEKQAISPPSEGIDLSDVDVTGQWEAQFESRAQGARKKIAEYRISTGIKRPSPSDSENMPCEKKRVVDFFANTKPEPSVLTLDEEEVLWPVLSTSVTEEEIKNHDIEKLSVFARKIRRNLKVEEKTIWEFCEDPNTSAKAGKNIPKGSYYVIKLTGYQKTMDVRVEGKDLSCVKFFMENFLEGLTKKEIPAACASIRDFQRKFSNT